MNPSSFGNLNYYIWSISLVNQDKHLWRKAARIVNKARMQMRPWPTVDREIQFQSTQSYVKQALRDTKLPDTVKSSLAYGMAAEFGFGNYHA